MSREHTRRVDAIRAQSSELENHLIDEYKSGHINRREFVRRGDGDRHVRAAGQLPGGGVRHR